MTTLPWFYLSLDVTEFFHFDAVTGCVTHEEKNGEMKNCRRKGQIWRMGP